MSTWSALVPLAGALAGTGALLAMPPGSRPPATWWRRTYRASKAAPAVAVVGGCAGLVLWLDGVRLGVALVVLEAVAAATALARRRRSDRQREAVRRRVVELSETLVGELRAGRPVVASLESCRPVWPPFGTVVAAAGLGADVPGALCDLARRPGAGGLARVASAWEVSQRTGCSLVAVLDQVAASARADQASARQVRAELASAQSTARLVALLPAATLSMAAASGADPWQFLLATPLGVACLCAGVTLVFLGLWWVELIASHAVAS